MAIRPLERQVSSPPSLSDEDLKPGRYTEHAVFGRGASSTAWLLFGISAGFAAMHRYRQGPLTRILSARTLDLLRPADWAWTIGGGVLLPLIWFLVVTRLTPLSAREWSLVSNHMIQTIGQFGALTVSILAVPIVIAVWRLGKRGRALGLRTRRPWFGWTVVGAALFAVPAFGGIMPAGAHGNIVMVLACILAGIPVLWLFVGFFRMILGNPTHALCRVTLARMALPAWIFGMLAMAVAVRLHYAEEQYWAQRDHLLEVTVEKPGPSRYEWEFTQVLRKELLEMME